MTAKRRTGRTKPKPPTCAACGARIRWADNDLLPGARIPLDFGTVAEGTRYVLVEAGGRTVACRVTDPARPGAADHRNTCPATRVVDDEQPRRRRDVDD